MTTTQNERGNWIDGTWIRSGEALTSTNPSTGTELGSFVAASAEDADAAIRAARAAFDAGVWAGDRSLRSRALLQFADRLEARVDELSLMLSREGGKLLQQTQWEVRGSVEWLRYAAATALLQTGGRALETVPGTYFHSAPEPMGVVGVISPWNSPIILTVRAIGPALAAGCTVVLKLPSQTGLTNAIFARVAAETALLPRGVLNVFTENGSDGASRLVKSRDVDAVSYTGSTQVGRIIAAEAAPTLKRLNLELGGKTPLIVFDDADLDVTIRQIVIALVAMNGQFCCTGSRVLVQRGIADTLRGALSQAYEHVRLGGSEDADAQLGPLIDRASVQRVDQAVARAAQKAHVLVRGGPVTDGPLAAGAFYRPSLIEVDDLGSPLVQEELFGPVQTFEVFDDEADAIGRANASEFGLAASVFTQDSARSRRIGKAIRAGHIWTNCWGVLSEHFEQSGFKQSGIGLLCGPRAIEEFQEVKVYATVDAPSAPA